MTPSQKLLLLWLTPGLPPPGPFGADGVTMSSLNELVSRFKPRTSRARQCQLAWKLWYDKLTWYEQNIGSPDVMRDAKDRITAIHANNGAQFGVDAQATIRLGSSGATVSAWQKVLGIAQTGIFDTNTLEATKNYQRAHSLDADGIVGPATWGTVSPGVSFKLPSVGTAGIVIGAAMFGIAVAWFSDSH